MATVTERLIVLDPTVEPDPMTAARAARPASLAGKTVGFLDNTKRNSDKVLRLLDEMLRERYGIAASVHRRKASASQVAATEILDELARTCDLVIPGVGD